MNIYDALRNMDVDKQIDGTSNLGLVMTVEAAAATLVAQSAGGASPLALKSASTAEGVDGGLMARPADAMLRLARATRPRIADDIYEWYQGWAILRYLGAFAHSDDLRLSKAGDAIAGNQRRVLSEELGIAVGVLVAEQWSRALGDVGSLEVVDLDVALAEQLNRTAVGDFDLRVNGRRPDYLLISTDRTSGAPVVRALECKGTRSSANTTSQLARALTQLASLEIDGSVPTGIAVSTVSTASGVSYLAVDPPGDDDSRPIHLSASDYERVRSGRAGPVDTERSRTLNVDGRDLLAASKLSAMGALADFGGNLDASRRYLAPATLARLSRSRGRRRERDVEAGSFVGVQHTFPLPSGESLHYFMGVADEVDRALSTGDPEVVADAQTRFADNLERSPFTAHAVGRRMLDASPRVQAVARDGAAIVIELDG